MTESDDALARHFAALAFVSETPRRVGVAVSGGGDSLAALHLMTKAGTSGGWQVRAVTVDHALRPEAADEARQVSAVCAGIGVPHTILRWQHGAIAGNLQDQARRARYRLMAEWARAADVSHVVLGHTADDQAETFLMGLARGAGIDGLVGMRACWVADGVTWVRPFLDLSRADLRGYLIRHGITWVDDPSNDDDRFSRVKARRAIKALKPLGISADKICGVMSNLLMVQGAVQMAVWQAAGQIAQTMAGEVIFDRNGVLALPQELQRRLIIVALRWVSMADYAPRADAVFRILMSIVQGKDATLWGCRVRVDDQSVRIAREPRAVSGLACATDQIWDGRWKIDGPHRETMAVRALGPAGLRLCPDWRATGFSRDALVVSPAVWQGETLIAAPLTGKCNGWSAKLADDFGSFIISH